MSAVGGSDARSAAQGADCDYIIVGGGSAGCIAAWRLLNETDARVVVLETGADYTSPYLKLMPGYSRLVPKGIHCTLHQTVPQKHAGNRVLEVATGRVLGGGSSVNAQVYMRGYRADYDQWGAAAGSDLWSWDAILPHFRRLEGNQKYDGEFHGSAGPLLVADPGFFCEFSRLFVKAGQAMGLPFTSDFNVGSPVGTGFLQFTANGGRRCSAAEAFLGKVRSNPRLRVITHAQVNRIVLQNQCAVGVDYLHGGRNHTLRCNGEVLLSAGALISPKLLMLSGIGPAESLGRLGIPVEVDLPGVGQNLHDHAGSPLVIQGNSQGFGYFRQDKGWRLLWNLLEYAMFRRGRLTTCGGEASSFHTTSAGPTPSVQIYCVPMIAYANTGADAIPAVDGIKLHVTLLRPHSRGTLSLRSANPSDLPLVDPNYLGDSRDLQNLVEGMRTARELAATTPLREGLRGEMLPGEAVKDDAGLADYIRSTVRTDWHPVGTCRMGRDDDPLGVVSEKLAVRGVERLRVIDASVMPNIVSANTNAPTMALADRGVSLMLSSGTG